jgi:hypothetical protein
LTDSDRNPSVRRRVRAVHWIPDPVCSRPRPWVGKFRIGSGPPRGSSQHAARCRRRPARGASSRSRDVAALHCPVVVQQKTSRQYVGGPPQSARLRASGASTFRRACTEDVHHWRCLISPPLRKPVPVTGFLCGAADLARFAADRFGPVTDRLRLVRTDAVGNGLATDPSPRPIQ